MKHEEHERLINGRLTSTWELDLIITSERGLAAAQVEYCINELCKLIDAPADWGNYENCAFIADGKYGGIEYETDGHYYHSIWLWVDDWCSKSNLSKIWYIVAAMVGDGARVEPWCENAFTKTFDYHFNNCYCVGYDAKRGYAQ